MQAIAEAARSPLEGAAASLAAASEPVSPLSDQCAGHVGRHHSLRKASSSSSSRHASNASLRFLRGMHGSAAETAEAVPVPDTASGTEDATCGQDGEDSWRLNLDAVSTSAAAGTALAPDPTHCVRAARDAAALAVADAATNAAAACGGAGSTAAGRRDTVPFVAAAPPVGVLPGAALLFPATPTCADLLSMPSPDAPAIHAGPADGPTALLKCSIGGGGLLSMTNVTGATQVFPSLLQASPRRSGDTLGMSSVDASPAAPDPHVLRGSWATQMPTWTTAASVAGDSRCSIHEQSLPRPTAEVDSTRPALQLSGCVSQHESVAGSESTDRGFPLPSLRNGEASLASEASRRTAKPPPSPSSSSSSRQSDDGSDSSSGSIPMVRVAIAPDSPCVPMVSFEPVRSLPTVSSLLPSSVMDENASPGPLAAHDAKPSDSGDARARGGVVGHLQALDLRKAATDGTGGTASEAMPAAPTLLWRALDCGSNRYAALSTRRHSPSCTCPVDPPSLTPPVSSASLLADHTHNSGLAPSFPNGCGVSIGPSCVRLPAAIALDAAAPTPFSPTACGVLHFASDRSDGRGPSALQLLLVHSRTESWDCSAAGQPPVATRGVDAANATFTAVGGATAVGAEEDSPPPSAVSAEAAVNHDDNGNSQSICRDAAAGEGDSACARTRSRTHAIHARGSSFSFHTAVDPSHMFTAATASTHPHRCVSNDETMVPESSCTSSLQQRPPQQELNLSFTDNKSFSRSSLTAASQRFGGWASAKFERVASFVTKRGAGSPTQLSLASLKEGEAGEDEEGRQANFQTRVRAEGAPYHRRDSLFARSTANELFFPSTSALFFAGGDGAASATDVAGQPHLGDALPLRTRRRPHVTPLSAVPEPFIGVLGGELALPIRSPSMARSPQLSYQRRQGAVAFLGEAHDASSGTHAVSRAPTSTPLIARRAMACGANAHDAAGPQQAVRDGSAAQSPRTPQRSLEQSMRSTVAGALRTVASVLSTSRRGGDADAGVLARHDSASRLSTEQAPPCKPAAHDRFLLTVSATGGIAPSHVAFGNTGDDGGVLGTFGEKHCHAPPPRTKVNYFGSGNRLADLLSHRLYVLFRTPPSLSFAAWGDCLAVFTQLQTACGKDGVPWEAIVSLLRPGDVIALADMFRALHLVGVEEFAEFVEVASLTHARGHFDRRERRI